MEEQPTMNSNQASDKVWPYLHGLLSDTEQTAFEARLDSDPDLRKQFAEARRLDAALKEVRPVANWSEEQLEDHLLALWEQDHRSIIAPETQFSSVSPGTHAQWLHFWTRPLPVAKAGLAAAFCILLAGIGLRLSSDYTTWDSPVISMPAYRGTTPAAGGQEANLQREQLEKIASQLEQSLELAYRNALGTRSACWSLHPRREWRMGLQIQSFRQGVLSVHVTAEHRKDKRLKLEWTEYFSNPDSLWKAREELGERIAGSLAEATAQKTESSALHDAQ